MCGIYCSISSGGTVLCSNETRELLKARGPDSEIELSFPSSSCASAPSEKGKEMFHTNVLCTVLALRGDAIESQPVRSQESESFLCWNGEAWKQNGQVIAGNDSRQVFNSLNRACLSTHLLDRDHVYDALTSIAGPFAFVFFDAQSSRILYGRDRLGRRSLLTQPLLDGGIAFCSITDDPRSPGWKEVESGGVHVIDVLNPSIPKYWPWPANRLNISPALPQGQVPLLGASSPVVFQLDQQLRNSLLLRIADIPSLGQFTRRQPYEHAKVAVLFSGGLDSAVLARLAHDQLPLNQPIDLLNVACENPRSLSAAAAATSKSYDGTSAYESCPDRQTGRSTHLELLRLCPGRQWRFVAIDIPYSESEKHVNTILRLMAPHNTEMDLSIAKALYFAARGQGHVTDSHSRQYNTPYSTEARVLLSGLGADELFAGYTRHARAFERGGYPRLIQELDLDFQRLGQRNLGRDDRVISHWGKEVRYPYLDDDFVAWALQLPVWQKCGFRPKPDHGTLSLAGDEDTSLESTTTTLDPAKKLLRLLAKRLGLAQAATAKKRAIQFGARTARMKVGTPRSKGTDTIVS